MGASVASDGSTQGLLMTVATLVTLNLRRNRPLQGLGETMNIVLSLDSKDGCELSSEYEDLERWLREEPDLRSSVTSKATPPNAGEMAGGVIEALTVALGSGGALTVLAGALFSWLKTVQHRRLVLDIHETKTGKRIKLDARNYTAQQIESLLRGIQEGGS